MFFPMFRVKVSQTVNLGQGPVTKSHPYPSATAPEPGVRRAALIGEIDGDAVAVRGESHRGAEGGQHLRRWI